MPLIDEIPLEWRRVRLQAPSVKRNPFDRSFYITGPGQRRRVLNVRLPFDGDDQGAIGRVHGTEVPIAAALCSGCNFGYSELVESYRSGHPHDHQCTCAECHWDLVAIKACQMQREWGINLGISDNYNDPEEEHRSRVRILQEHLAAMHKGIRSTIRGGRMRDR